jgi:hypothetical protein
VLLGLQPVLEHLRREALFADLPIDGLPLRIAPGLPVTERPAVAALLALLL